MCEGTKRAIVAMLPELHAKGYEVREGEIGTMIVQSEYREHTPEELEAASKAHDEMCETDR